MDVSTQLFRIGQGYLDYWFHEPDHWNTSEREDVALAALAESFRRLLELRGRVENARRSCSPASPLDTSTRPSTAAQQQLFDDTHAFYLAFYATLSSFVSLLARFEQEVGGVPKDSNKRFISWLEPRALMPSVSIPLLEEARQFRTLLDHQASHQPYEWGTVAVEGWIRVMLYGEASQAGRIPGGALGAIEGLDSLPESTGWTFIAPDEDRVLSAVALQLNALFPLLAAHRFDDHLARGCRWEPRHYDGENPAGYPIFAAISGVVTSVGSMSEMPRHRGPSTKDRKAARRRIRTSSMDEILGAYFDESGDVRRDSFGNPTNEA